jgi:ABC-type polysaccharide/polyol phosphate export permease
MRLALYVSPVLYSIDQFTERVPDWLATMYELNPLALLLEGFRDAAYNGVAPSPLSIVLPLAVGVLLLPVALAWFGRVEPRFGKAL